MALISGRVMGDECTDCYYWCGTCGAYTLRLYRDVFAGEETVRDSEPSSKAEGDRGLELIRSLSGVNYSSRSATTISPYRRQLQAWQSSLAPLHWCWPEQRVRLCRDAT